MPLPATIPLPSGLALPAVGFGTYRLRGQEAFDAVSWALAAGVRHVDTASAYRNEREVAAALAASGVPRADVFLTTKVGPKQQGTERATAATEASLAALGEPLDAILVHWPGAAGEDAASPAAAQLRRQTWRVLEGLHAAGRVRAIGVSNYEPRHLEELLSYAQVKPGECGEGRRHAPQSAAPGSLAGRPCRPCCAPPCLSPAAPASLRSDQPSGVSPSLAAAPAARAVRRARHRRRGGEPRQRWGRQQRCAAGGREGASAAALCPAALTATLLHLLIPLSPASTVCIAGGGSADRQPHSGGGGGCGGHHAGAGAAPVGPAPRLRRRGLGGRPLGLTADAL